MNETERCADEHCVTCGDVAESMRVVEAPAGDSLAVCLAPSGERLTVEAALVAPVVTGEVLLVHAGTAIARAAPGRESGIQGPRRGRGQGLPARAEEAAD